MPKDHSQPINEADRQARAAFKAFDGWLRLHGQLAFVSPINPRTWERITAGARDVPPGLARELASNLRELMGTQRDRTQLESWAMALELWADDCDERSKAARHA